MTKHPYSVAGWAVAFIIMVLLATGGNIVFTLWQVEISQHQMCQLLESVPSPQKPPAGNHVAQQQGFQFFTRLKVLESQYGCI